MSLLLLGAVLLGNLRICVAAQEAAPVQVRFNSTDYRNILLWDPPSNSSSSLHYTVQWKIYGTPDWLPAGSCRRIRALQCDLTSITADTREWYYARVCATSDPASSQSACALSPRFSPSWDTVISPPRLSLKATRRGLVVQAKAPRALVHRVHKNLLYNIYVSRDEETEELHELECCFHKLTLTGLKPQTQYCLQAETVIPEHLRISERSHVKCTTTA